MQNKKICLLIVFIQMLFIINISFTQQNNDFVPKEKVIEIIKLSSSRFRKGYNGKAIVDYQIKFYVNNERVDYFNTFNKKFEKNNITLSQNQISDIHNFIGYINENASEYKKLKFNLIDVYENLQYMKQRNIDFVKIDDLITIIKLSAKRPNKGYKVTKFYRKQIEFYINNNKVDDFNNLKSLFEKNNIKLSKTEISNIHNFIGYISENTSEYKKLKFNLMDVYNNLQYMK